MERTPRLFHTMLHLQIMFTAVAAVVALQIGLSSCVAEEISEGMDVTMEPKDALGLPRFINRDFFFNLDSMLQESMSSFVNLLGAQRTMLPVAGSSLSLSLVKDDLKSCRVKIAMGSAVRASGLKVGLHTGGRRVNVTFHMKDTHEQHDPEKGDSHSSSTVHMSSTLMLPEECIATPAALLSNLVGYLVDSATATKHNCGMIVFPSKPLLQEYAEKKLLPENIIEAIEKGDMRELGELSPPQLCLAAGFTLSECEKLGNKKPDVVSVAALDSPDSMPIPLYDASLEILD